MVLESAMCFPIFIHYFLTVRKSVIHLQVAGIDLRYIFYMCPIGKQGSNWAKQISNSKVEKIIKTIADPT